MPDDPALVDQARRRYAALLAKCDESLGRVLDAFDRHGLWEDTALVVWTDHGLLLGEHGWMMKNEPPLYEEVSHTPLFVHDPRSPDPGGRRSALVQPAVDLAPTLLGLFGVGPGEHMIGRDLAAVLADDSPVREAAIFGYHSQAVNLVTDRHVYYRAPAEGAAKADAYTTHMVWMRGRLGPDAQRDAVQVADPLPHARGVRPFKLAGQGTHDAGTSPLFDLVDDPAQDRPLDDPALEAELGRVMAGLMAEADAPAEQYARLGLTQP